MSGLPLILDKETEYLCGHLCKERLSENNSHNGHKSMVKRDSAHLHDSSVFFPSLIGIIGIMGS